MKKLERILLGLLILAFIIVAGVNINAKNYMIDTVNFTDATVNTGTLNMRQGPSESMEVVGKLEKSQAVKVLGKTGEWYFVFDTSSGKVGCVHGKYITPVTGETMDETKLPNGGAVNQGGEDKVPKGLTVDEYTLFELVNTARETAHVGAIKYNKELAKVAYDKAKDMVVNNYFSHTSKTYGSPFQMMRSYGIVFTAAAENIAGNQSVEKAYYSWMASEGHKKNILNPDYDEMGIGVYISPIYGKIMVQMFIRK